MEYMSEIATVSCVFSQREIPDWLQQLAAYIGGFCGPVVMLLCREFVGNMQGQNKLLSDTELVILKQQT